MSKDAFSEKLFEAITDIDDEFLIEADEENTNHRNRNRSHILLIAACFVFTVVVAAPIIAVMNGGFGRLASKDNAFSMAETADGVDVAGDSANCGIIPETDEFNGYTIHMNYYDGYILDDSTKDPQEVLSLMKTTDINEKSYYIVVVRSERIKVYDVATLELIADKEGTSVEDVALDLDIAG